MKRILTSFALAVLFHSFIIAQPTVSFTFDDGVTTDQPGYAFREWNKMLLDKLDEAELKAVFFVTGRNKTDKKGRYLLRSWDERGHQLANHTYTHPFYNSDEISSKDFVAEISKTDAIIEEYENYTKLFRFPYLKEGNTEEKVNSIRDFLREQGYRNGYVTIDASDWYIDSRLRKKLIQDTTASVEDFRKFYLNHLYERAQFYEKLSYALTGRHIPHTLLLHHNLAAALFVDDLIEMFQDKGWQVVSANEAYADPIFDKEPNYAGESLIWALAKDSGQFEDILRYPAEDEQYEKDKMDKLGL